MAINIKAFSDLENGGTSGIPMIRHLYVHNVINKPHGLRAV